MSEKAPRSFNTFRHSNRELRKEKRRRARATLLAICIVIIMILLALSAFLFCSIADAAKTPGKTEASSTPPAGSLEQVEKISKLPADISKGDLLLVNNAHYYDPASAQNLVIIEGSQVLPNGSKLYTVGDVSWKLNETTLKAFNAMMQKFNEISEGDDNIKINSAYRTAKDQEGKSAPVGHSDHHTGYCIALRPITPQHGYLESTHWLYEDGYKFGFILRYPSGKEAITGVEDYTYCIRYVGVAHATYIYQQGLCLEEYVALLQKNYANGEVLKITGADGNSYEVYYVAKSAEEITTISVPKGYDYTISGDNVGGFIVTVNRSAKTE